MTRSALALLCLLAVTDPVVAQYPPVQPACFGGFAARQPYCPTCPQRPAHQQPGQCPCPGGVCPEGCQPGAATAQVIYQPLIQTTYAPPCQQPGTCPGGFCPQR